MPVSKPETTPRTPRRVRIGRAVYRWSLIAGLVLFAGMLASLAWHALLPLWSNPDAGADQRATAFSLAAMVAINGSIAVAALGVIGWIVRYLLTGERSPWPGGEE